MKFRHWLAAVLTFTFGTALMAAQAPAGSTGQCRDGSYTTAAKKAGACSGHKGVQTWFTASGGGASTGAPAASQSSNTQAAAPSSTPERTPAPAPSTSPARSSAVSPEPTSSTASAPASSSSGTAGAPRAQAPGGGPGMVWVNTSTKVYHCPGKEFYGTTKNGKYMSESDAVAMGTRADHNKPCAK